MYAWRHASLQFACYIIKRKNFTNHSASNCSQMDERIEVYIPLLLTIVYNLVAVASSRLLHLNTILHAFRIRQVVELDGDSLQIETLMKIYHRKCRVKVTLYTFLSVQRGLFNSFNACSFPPKRKKESLSLELSWRN